MYYFLPKAAGRRVYWYRLSVVHFWSLVFVYIWAGPHHLLNTALPGWLQTLGMTFSLMLWAPSWGGMLNGLLTLRGAWDKVRTDPVLKFFAAAVTSYGMATFEGPLFRSSPSMRWPTTPTGSSPMCTWGPWAGTKQTTTEPKMAQDAEPAPMPRRRSRLLAVDRPLFTFSDSTACSATRRGTPAPSSKTASLLGCPSSPPESTVLTSPAKR